MDTLTVINDYVIANEKHLKNICFRLYRGNHLWEDLFQEFYLKIIETKAERLKKFSLKNLCYWEIEEVYLKRNRPGSPLKINGVESLEGLQIQGEKPNYLFDLRDFVDDQMNKTTGFVPVTVFVESMDTPIKELSRKTKIHRQALHKHKADGKKILYNFVKHNQYD